MKRAAMRGTVMMRYISSEYMYLITFYPPKKLLLLHQHAGLRALDDSNING